VIFEKVFGLTPTNSLLETLFVLSTTWIFRDHDVLPRNISNPTIIDIGAHIGITALYFSRHNPTAKIICYEPNPDIFTILKKNTRRAMNIKLINSAVHDYSGRAKFKIGTQAWGGSLLDNGETNTINVKVTPASLVCHDHIDLLKLDAEGSEYAIIVDLDKAGKLANVDRIVMEYHGKINDKNRLKQILDVYKKNNFEYTIGQYLRILKVDEKKVLRSSLPIYDYLIISAWKKGINSRN
jgi:FkbM family methyltransferase